MIKKAARRRGVAYPAPPPVFKPRLHLEGQHAKGLVQGTKVGQRVQALVTGRVTSLEQRHDSLEGRGRVRHNAVIEIDRTKIR